MFALVKCSHPHCIIRTQRTKLNSRERQCSNRIVSCSSFGCSERVLYLYKDLHNHLETCPWRIHTCKICNESTTYKDRAKHYATRINVLTLIRCFFTKDFQRHILESWKIDLWDEIFRKIKQNGQEMRLLFAMQSSKSWISFEGLVKPISSKYMYGIKDVKQK